MNRENKLALIIGFTLILVVGVLISDHLSRANRDALDEPVQVAKADTGAANNALLSGTLNNAIKPSPEPRANTYRPERQRAAPVVQQRPARQATAPAIDTRLVIRPQRTTPAPARAAKAQPKAAASPEVIGQGLAGNRELEPVQPDEVLNLLASTAGTMFEKWGESAVQPLTQTTTNTPKPPPVRTTDRVLREPARTVAAPIARPVRTKTDKQYHKYTVQEGDALILIARKYLGNGTKWTIIRDANPKVIGAEGQLREGTTIRIPAAGKAKRAGTKPAPAKSKSRSYTVQSGDSLSRIAARLLGSADKWQAIATANKIDDPTALRIGQKLVIPAS